MLTRLGAILHAPSSANPHILSCATSSTQIKRRGSPSAIPYRDVCGRESRSFSLDLTFLAFSCGPSQKCGVAPRQLAPHGPRQCLAGPGVLRSPGILSGRPPLVSAFFGLSRSSSDSEVVRPLTSRPSHAPMTQRRRVAVGFVVKPNRTNSSFDISQPCRSHVAPPRD